MLKVTRLTFFAIFLWTISSKTSLGIDVDISDHPYLVALRYKSNIQEGYQHVCSGSIYNQSIIITTASCLNAHITPVNYQVVAGSNILDGSQGAVALIDHIVLHYDYSKNSVKNDLAVVILKTPLPINGAKIAAIQFADREMNPGSIQTAIGWKRNVTAGSLLQSFVVSIFSKTRCQEAFGKKATQIICGNSWDICTQGPGSLLLYDNNKLAGILSGNSDCEASTQYYANVVELKDWIERTLRGEIILPPKPTFL